MSFLDDARRAAANPAAPDAALGSDPPSVPGGADVQAAASALLAGLNVVPSTATPALVGAFQRAYNEAGGAPRLDEDSTWGSNTEQALLGYGRPSMPGYVPRQRTLVALPVFANALASAWPAVVGGVAPLAAVQLLAAQSALETAQWSATGNYNFGNIKHVPGDGFPFFFGLDRCRYQGQPVPCMFRAYPDMTSGMRDFLNLLAHGQRYQSAWPYALQGNAVGFVNALKAGGYFEATAADYLRGVQSYLSKFQSLLPSEKALRGAAVKGAEVAGIGVGIYVAGGAAFLAGLAAWEWWKNR